MGVPAGGSAQAAAGPVDLDQYGRGDYDPDTGLYDWYDVPPEQLRRLEHHADGLTWAALFERWALVEADLHQLYGIDIDDPALMGARNWRWLRTRIIALQSTSESRLWRSQQPRRR